MSTTLTPENFEQMRQRCIPAVLEAMKTLAPAAYIGGEGSEDGIYVAGVDEQDKILYLTHFDWEEVKEILSAMENGTLREWLIEYNRPET
ncbi:MAG: hypothetical protein K2O69_00560 [Odoribacter sp.]|nr:hypothetical protein [Odoribacter sp.]